MRRDMDLIRSMLQATADSPGPLGLATFVDDQHTRETVVYHYQLLSESGLAKVTMSWAGNVCRHAEIVSLTWAGCDLLDSIASDQIWRSVKRELTKVGGAATVEIVKAAARSVIMGQLGLA